MYILFNNNNITINNINIKYKGKIFIIYNENSYIEINENEMNEYIMKYKNIIILTTSEAVAQVTTSEAVAQVTTSEAVAQVTTSEAVAQVTTSEGISKNNQDLCKILKNIKLELNKKCNILIDLKVIKNNYIVNYLIADNIKYKKIFDIYDNINIIFNNTKQDNINFVSKYHNLLKKYKKKVKDNKKYNDIVNKIQCTLNNFKFNDLKINIDNNINKILEDISKDKALIEIRMKKKNKIYDLKSNINDKLKKIKSNELIIEYKKIIKYLDKILQYDEDINNDYIQKIINNINRKQISVNMITKLKIEKRKLKNSIYYNEIKDINIDKLETKIDYYKYYQLFKKIDK
jgi:hypothetical protein